MLTPTQLHLFESMGRLRFLRDMRSSFRLTANTVMSWHQLFERAKG